MINIWLTLQTLKSELKVYNDCMSIVFRSLIQKILSSPKLLPCLLVLGIAIAILVSNSYENSVHASGGGGYIRDTIAGNCSACSSSIPGSFK